MWLWILSALFLLVVWGLWFILQPTPGTPEPEIFPTWLALTITGVVVLALIGLVVYRRIRARRAARALEKAIAQQAQEQVATTKPENRAEIQELQRRMMEGIRSLKASRLGEGGDALYSLPWYAIVGPPGAGKTTALRYSGLSFPYLDPEGGGVRGVGGTRNCDWWFTNDAILLDTAGRYTTQADDRDEWIAFLDMLKNFRKHKPLNGVFVAVSVAELIDASEEEIQQTAERIRDRIDEMQDRLKMILPVYVLFTKCDLIAGFSEYFGDLKRSERGQIWGTTLTLASDKSNVGGIFDGEFDILVEQLHKRTIRRIGMGRGSRAEREKIYQFPLEFAAIKRNLSEFMGAAFRPAPPPAGRKARVIPTPVLRGMYFTSGTQEGKPLDRVVGAMGRAFGLRPVEKEADKATESKSFFLKDVFERVAFPDRDVAGRTEDEIRRVRWQQIGVAAAAVAIAAILMIPAIFSFIDNRALIKETKKISDDTGAIAWDQGDVLPKIEQLDKLRAQLEKLDQWKEEGPPVSMRWGMYQGDKLFEPAVMQYISALHHGFIEPVRMQLERKLRSATGANYLEEYEALKTYLLLGKDELYWGHLPENEQWQVSRLTREWAESLRAAPGSVNVSEGDLRDKIRGHVGYYVSLRKRSLKNSPVAGEELNDQTIAFTRNKLTQVGDARALYARFVDVLELETYIDPSDSSEKPKYPPIMLNDLFSDRPAALTVLSSKRKKREGKFQPVRGPYTYSGHEAVLASLRDGYKILEREKWVVPVTSDELAQPARIKKSLERVRQDYDQRYIDEWRAFFADIDVKVPANNIDAISEFKVLSTVDWPYWRLLRALRDNTQFDKIAAENATAADKAAADGGVLDQIKQKAKKKFDTKVRVHGAADMLLSGGANEERLDPVPEVYRKMVEFGFPDAPKEGEPPPPSGLSGYINTLEQLASEMQVIEEGPPNGDTKKATELFEKAVKDTEQKLLTLDDTGQLLMRELLLNPLKQSYKAMLKSAGGAASGLWEVTVWPPYKANIMNRYPFNTAARRDASFEDFIAFYKPKDGILWGFYEAYLKDMHMKVQHKFVPATHLQGYAPAKRFTPFNPLMYNCLERSDEITDALFNGQEKPKLEFNVNLTTVSPIVSEIIFTLDGDKRLYRNEKEFWHEFTWPGPEPATGASIRIKGAGGLDEELRRDGPWGLWRLLESGVHTAEKDNDKVFRVEWQFAAPPVIVKIQIRPKRQNHPFPLNFFRDTNCPPSIGDTFGG